MPAIGHGKTSVLLTGTKEHRKIKGHAIASFTYDKV
jgi:hypothetical protein